MMNRAGGKKLRQTTLDFVTSNKSELKKRKMDGCSKDSGDFETLGVDIERAEKRNKVCTAAEKRREANVPYSRNSSVEEDVNTERCEQDKRLGSECRADPSTLTAGSSTKPVDKPVLCTKLSDQSTSDSGTTATSQLHNMSQDLDDFEDISTPVDKHSSQETKTCMFSANQIPNAKPGHTGHWKGVDKSELDTAPSCYSSLHPLKSSDKHVVMFCLPYQYDVNHTTIPPTPHPLHYIDKWDGDHVRMPCSNENKYPVEIMGQTSLQQRWDLIEEALLVDILGPFELAEAILTYNQRYKTKWSFEALTYYFIEHISEEERFEFFKTTLKAMIQLALRLPYLCTKPIPLLKRGKNKSITMSQEQVACLLANAFFCTFPRRNTKARRAEYSSFPDINFNILFNGEPNKKKMHKLKCIMHYFKRVTTQVPLGVITYTRQVVHKLPDWRTLQVDLSRLHVSSMGTIEDDGTGMLQVDFANKVIGGGVLMHGCVQEEIRFLICPEMILSRLFTEILDTNESIIMLGCEQFSEYNGYADKFEWACDHYDKTCRDINGHLCTEVVAIDALVIHQQCDQFQSQKVERELNKAYSGFMSRLDERLLPAVCTGNWGCGAFGGNKMLKALIQLCAAAAAKRDVCYFTFEDDKLVDELYDIHRYLTKENHLHIGHIVKLIDRYYKNVCKKCFYKPEINLFNYIKGPLDDTDTDRTLTRCESSEDKNKTEKPNFSQNTSIDYKANTP